MNVPFFEALTAEIKKVEVEKGVHSMVLSSSQKVFSAGLDLTSMYGKTEEELRHFWTTFRAMWLTLYSTPLFTVSAIQGPSPAGGCLMAIACDARVASANSNIGLNEAAFGLVVPEWGIDAMVDVMGQRQAEKACSIGTIFAADEALALGLLDTVVAAPEEVMAEAMTEVMRWRQPGRAASKALIREARYQKFHDCAEKDIKGFLDLVQHPRTQAALGAYLESLKTRKK